MTAGRSRAGVDGHGARGVTGLCALSGGGVEVPLGQRDAGAWKNRVYGTLLQPSERVAAGAVGRSQRTWAPEEASYSETDVPTTARRPPTHRPADATALRMVTSSGGPATSGSTVTGVAALWLVASRYHSAR
jgi:hypothetical protein